MELLLLTNLDARVPLDLARRMGSGTRLLEPATMTVVRRWRTEKEVPCPRPPSD